MGWLIKYLPFIHRYNRNYEREVIDPVRAIVFISLLHILIFAWLWLFTERVVPDFIFGFFSGIVLWGVAADIWKTHIKNKDHDL